MATQSVQTSFWVDHSRSPVNRYQMLFSESTAGIVTNFLAVLITTSGLPIFNLVGARLDRLCEILIPQWTIDRNNEQTHLDGFFALTLAILKTFRPAALIQLPTNGNASRSRKHILRCALGSIVTLIMVDIIPIGLIVLSIVSSGMATNSVARLTSDKCGVYTYRRTSTNKTPVQFLEFEHRSETEASSYASNCYRPNQPIEECTKFFNQSINYRIGDTAECPFHSNVCADTKSVYQLTTNLVSGSVLGINTENPFYFGRTMTCSPLLANDNYVKKGKSQQGFDQYEYYYGSYDSHNDLTYTNLVGNTLGKSKGYTMEVRYSFPWAKSNPFQPRKAFTAGSNPVTILFITTNNVKYSESRSDPIFPANTATVPDPKHPNAVQFYNNNTKAGVLGCVDEMKICKTLTGPCWTYENVTSMQRDLRLSTSTAHDQPGSKDQLVAYLIQNSLNHATAYGSTRFRGAEALDAQVKIANQQSLDLPELQWQVEAEKMFRTALARIQLNAYDIVRGTASSFTDYHNGMPSRYRGICRLLSMRVNGYKNVNTLGLFGTLFAVGMLWLLGWNVRYYDGREKLLAVLLWEELLRPACLWSWYCFESLVLQPCSRFWLGTPIPNRPEEPREEDNQGLLAGAEHNAVELEHLREEDGYEQPRVGELVGQVGRGVPMDNEQIMDNDDPEVRVELPAMRMVEAP